MQAPKFYQSSIGKKFLMASTGLIMCLFLVGHLLGNLLLYVSKDAFNNYANLLNSTNLVYFAELFLIVVLFAHVITAIQISNENKVANPSKYAVKNSGGKRNWASSHMLHTGVIIFIFLIVHLVTMKFGNWSNLPESRYTLYDLVAHRFSELYYAAFYVVSMILLGFHLHHAVKSACLTLGISNTSVVAAVSAVSAIYSIAVTVGFVSFPVFFYLKSITL